MAIPYDQSIETNPFRAREVSKPAKEAKAPALDAARSKPAPDRSMDESATLVTARQIRAGRALLGWSQKQLSDAAKVGPATIARIELGTIDPKASSLKAIADALRGAGVRLFDDSDGIGEGARMAKPDGVDG